MKIQKFKDKLRKRDTDEVIRDLIHILSLYKKATKGGEDVEGIDLYLRSLSKQFSSLKFFGGKQETFNMENEIVDKLLGLLKEIKGHEKLSSFIEKGSGELKKLSNQS